MARKGKISIVLIGAGGMGARWAEAIVAHPKTSLAGIIDTNRGKAEALGKAHHIPAFTSLKDFLRRFSCDAACIAIPPAFSKKATSDSFKAGLHVIIEKPAARNSSELRALLSLAKKKRLRFMVGYNYRHFPHIQKAYELVQKGTIGSILFIRARHGASGRPGYEHDWRHNPALSGGGVLIDTAVHTIDLARWFLGDFKKIKGTLAHSFWKSKVEDNAFIHLQTRTGQIASLHASWTEWHPIFSFEIFGANGYIKAQGLRQYRQKEELIFAKRPADFLGSHVQERIETFPKSKPQDSLAGELDEFASAVRDIRDPCPSGQDALEILKIVDHIYAS